MKYYIFILFSGSPGGQRSVAGRSTVCAIPGPAQQRTNREVAQRRPRKQEDTGNAHRFPGLPRFKKKLPYGTVSMTRSISSSLDQPKKKTARGSRGSRSPRKPKKKSARGSRRSRSPRNPKKKSTRGSRRSRSPPKRESYHADSERRAHAAKGASFQESIRDRIVTRYITAFHLDKAQHKGYRTYLVHSNGARPFLVAYDRTGVKVYRQSVALLSADIAQINGEMYDTTNMGTEDLPRYAWNVLVFQSSKVKNIFIGKSPKTRLTLQSGGYGKDFDGNTVLIELLDGRAVFVGAIVYSFKPEGSILSYTSPVGGSDVPYPYAVGTLNVYFLEEQKYAPLRVFSEIPESQWHDIFSCVVSSNLLDVTFPIPNIKVLAWDPEALVVR